MDRGEAGNISIREEIQEEAAKILKAFFSASVEKKNMDLQYVLEKILTGRAQKRQGPKTEATSC